jgi:hypothetical protein
MGAPGPQSTFPVCREGAATKFLAANNKKFYWAMIIPSEHTPSERKFSAGTIVNAK